MKPKAFRPPLEALPSDTEVGYPLLLDVKFVSESERKEINLFFTTSLVYAVSYFSRTLPFSILTLDNDVLISFDGTDFVAHESIKALVVAYMAASTHLLTGVEKDMIARVEAHYIPQLESLAAQVKSLSDTLAAQSTQPTSTVSTEVVTPVEEATPVEFVSTEVVAPVEEVAPVEFVSTEVAVPVEEATPVEFVSTEVAVPVEEATPVEFVSTEVVTPVEEATPVEFVSTEVVAPVEEATPVEFVSTEVVAPVEEVAPVEFVSTEVVTPVEEVAPVEFVSTEVVTPVEEVAPVEVYAKTTVELVEPILEQFARGGITALVAAESIVGAAYEDDHVESAEGKAFLAEMSVELAKILEQNRGITLQGLLSLLHTLSQYNQSMKDLFEDFMLKF